MVKVTEAIFADHVRELSTSVVGLSRSHAVLWALWSPKSCTQFEKEIKDHEDYFAAVTDSLFRSFCVITYQIFDKRPDVKSLPYLVGYLSSLNPTLERELNRRIESQRCLLDKYFRFRHKIYAHRDRTQPPWELFGTVTKARLRREMTAIVLLSRKCISGMAGATDKDKTAELAQEIRHRAKYAYKDTERIMDALQREPRL